MPKNQNYLTATGKIPYNMTNDYMFRAILQKNEKVLRGLVSSMLHMRVDNIIDIRIDNPIVLGEAINKKTIVLDIRITLNNNTNINLEMQVINERNWTDRSLFYLCRTFCQLDQGNDYNELLPTIHIGFLDFTLFPDLPEFFALYKLLNTKNYHLYSDKFTLNVVDLNRTDLATDEDKAYGIDQWVKIFKATTWEELRMLSENNEYVKEVMNTMYECNVDCDICKQCSDRAAELAFQQMEERRKKKLEEEYKQLEIETAKLKAQCAQLNADYTQLNDDYTQLNDDYSQLNDDYSQLNDEINAKDAEINLLENENASLKARIAFLENMKSNA